jgi:hypothetical protein
MQGGLSRNSSVLSAGKTLKMQEQKLAEVQPPQASSFMIDRNKLDGREKGTISR